MWGPRERGCKLKKNLVSGYVPMFASGAWRGPVGDAAHRLGRLRAARLGASRMRLSCIVDLLGAWMNVKVG